MENPSFKEDHISQIPALQLLQKLGYSYLSQQEAEKLRSGKTSNVLLEDILRKALKKINSEKKISSTKSTYFSDNNIENGIRILKEFPMNEGYTNASETAYNLLTLGKSVDQIIDGDKKSFTLEYIDWKHPENNVFHVMEEFSVMRSISKEHYRNRFLASAMFNLKMVDTAGGGIKKIFNFQRERFFPMPDYDLSAGKVKVTISGKVLDMEYARLLARNRDLTLEEIIILDEVQKKQVLTDFEEKHLRVKKLIEGRKPNYYIGIKVAQKTGQKATYSKNKAFDKSYYLDFIEKAIKEHSSLERSDIDELLWNKLPDWMDDKQKKNKIGNLLTEMRVKNRIYNSGTFSKSKWSLKK
jgi:hypothetical protein